MWSGNTPITRPQTPLLQSAIQPYANLTGADLTDFDLTDATLTGDDLTGVDLSGANLTGANMDGLRWDTPTYLGLMPGESASAMLI
jgi:uncharacterized protein YjbI with pentapeptide repeats